MATGSDGPSLLEDCLPVLALSRAVIRPKPIPYEAVEKFDELRKKLSEDLRLR